MDPFGMPPRCRSVRHRLPTSLGSDLRCSASCSALPAAGAIDSIKNRSRDASNALLGKEKTMMDEVGDMCPSMTFTQASATPAGCAAVSLPLSPAACARRVVAAHRRACAGSASGGSGSAAGWASC